MPSRVGLSSSENERGDQNEEGHVRVRARQPPRQARLHGDGHGLWTPWPLPLPQDSEEVGVVEEPIVQSTGRWALVVSTPRKQIVDGFTHAD